MIQEFNIYKTQEVQKKILDGQRYGIRNMECEIWKKARVRNSIPRLFFTKAFWEQEW